MCVRVHQSSHFEHGAFFFERALTTNSISSFSISSLIYWNKVVHNNPVFFLNICRFCDYVVSFIPGICNCTLLLFYFLFFMFFTNKYG